jgi:predicted DNA-binding antitoxin AbrB/MazE fold protein
MTLQLEAVYEDGVLRPVEPLSLPEHERVTLTLATKPKPRSWKSDESFNPRTEEMRWYSDHSANYPGQWLALEGSKMFASGERLVEVRDAAKAAGAVDPLFAQVPEDSLPFGGW